MAGTLVADVLQDGAGNSTAMDNAIYGSAKAWVNYNGSTATILASYNVSSITVSSTGKYVVNFTNAFSDANYAVVATGGNNTGGNQVAVFAPANGVGALTTGFSLEVYSASSSGDVNPVRLGVAVFR